MNKINNMTEAIESIKTIEAGERATFSLLSYVYGDKSPKTVEGKALRDSFLANLRKELGVKSSKNVITGSTPEKQRLYRKACNILRLNTEEKKKSRQKAKQASKTPAKKIEIETTDSDSVSVDGSFTAEQMENKLRFAVANLLHVQGYTIDQVLAVVATVK
jgi:ABC-type lipoprotein release transport system permease subunit